MKNRQSSLLCVLKIYFHNRIFYISQLNISKDSKRIIDMLTMDIKPCI